jgi:serine/threonine protein kinase
LDEVKLTAAAQQHVEEMRRQGINTPLKGLQNDGDLGNGIFAGCFRVSTAQGWKRTMCCKSTPLLPKDDSAGAAYITETHTKGAINEAQALSYLTLMELSNVVKIWGVYFFGGSILTLLEYAPGGTLEKEVKGYVTEGGVLVEAPGEERCVEIVRVLLRTSERMKRVGVLRLDLKPANVLRGEKGELVVTDFNCTRVLKCLLVARMRGGEEVAEEWVETESTRCDSKYAAAEVLNDAPFDDKAQVFSVGRMVVELCLGKAYLKKVYDENNSREEVMEAMAGCGWTKEGMDFLRKMLASDPAERPTAAELEREWASAARGLA